MKRTTGIVAGAVAVGLVVGFGLGRLTAPAPPAPGSRAMQAPVPDAAPPAPADGAAPVDGETLADMRALAERALDWGADPHDVLDVAMDRMSDDQLITLVVSLTDYEREELEGVQDVRAFVRRLAEIAMDGTVADAGDLPPDLARVSFATEVAADNRALSPREHFSPSAERIYAVLESDTLGGEEIFAKWIHADEGEVILFGRYAIEPGDSYSYVWLGRPGSGWEPGTYRVDFYTADEQLELLASGTHVITP